MTEEKEQEPLNRGEIEEEPDRNPDGTFAEGREKTGGKQKGYKFSLVSILRDQLQEVSEGEKEGKAKELVKKAIELAVGGDTQMLKDIINRIDGMPKQSLELGVDETIESVKIEIVRPKEEKKDDKENSQK